MFELGTVLILIAASFATATVSAILGMAGGVTLLGVMTAVPLPTAVSCCTASSGTEPSGVGGGRAGKLVPRMTFYNLENGKFYTAADTIDLLVNNDADAAKIRVWATVLDYNE